MKFTKMHGIGNDYVYVNCFQEKVDNPSEVAKFVSDRHFGVGADGRSDRRPQASAGPEEQVPEHRRVWLRLREHEHRPGRYR